jgi:hypothetical protein
MSLDLATGSVRAALSERGDDLYETPACAVHALLAVEPVPLTVWEPACGPGAIVSILRASGRAVVATDLVAWGCPDSESGVDFLMECNAPDGVPAIVTNPPFKLADEFAAHALLVRVWMFAPRLPFMHRHGYEGKKNSNSGMPFAWFVFHRDAAKDQAAQVRWINPRDYENTQ